MKPTDLRVASLLNGMVHTRRSGTIVFSGTFDEVIQQVRSQIRREEAAQDVFASEPHYEPGISFSNGSR